MEETQKKLTREELLKKFEEESKESMKERGLKPALKLVNGENHLKFKSLDAEVIETKFGEKFLFELEDSDYVLLASSFLASFLVDYNKLDVVIIKSGKGVDTRYEVKE